MKKKIGILLLTLTCLLFGSVMSVYAADGEIQFSDLTVRAGEDVSMRVRMLSNDGGAIGDGEAQLTYDPALLEFVSGAAETGANGSVVGGDGTVTVQASGTGVETELTFALTFRALAEGNATVQAVSSTAYMYSNDTLNLISGTGAVVIEPGDGTITEGDNSSTTVPAGDAITVQVNGIDYTLNETFTEAVIPNGFEEATLNIQGTDHRVLLNSASGKYLGYLTDANGESDYYLYNDADGTFVQAELVDVSQVTSIIIYNPTDAAALPAEYQETTSTINNKEFVAWHNTTEPDYFLIYALSSDGSEGYYQYDSIQQTYQRFNAIATENDEDSATGIVGTVQNFVMDHLMILLGAIAAVILLMLILLIVVSTKLRHRNVELDELYDELEAGGSDSDDYIEDSYDDVEEDYDDDVEDDLEEEDLEDFEEEDFEEDDFDEDDFEDDLDEDDFEDDLDEDDFEDDDYEEDELEDEDFMDDFEEDDFEDDLDEEDIDEEDVEDEEDRFLTKVIRKSKPVEDDFSIDFIDLDD